MTNRDQLAPPLDEWVRSRLGERYGVKILEDPLLRAPYGVHREERFIWLRPGLTPCARLYGMVHSLRYLLGEHDMLDFACPDEGATVIDLRSQAAMRRCPHPSW